MFHEPTNFTTSTTTALIPTTIYRGMGEQEFRIWRVRFARSVRHSNDDKVDIDIMTPEYKKEEWARNRRLKAVWVPLVIKAIKTIWDHLESVYRERKSPRTEPWTTSRKEAGLKSQRVSSRIKRKWCFWKPRQERFKRKKWSIVSNPAYRLSKLKTNNLPLTSIDYDLLPGIWW